MKKHSQTERILMKFFRYATESGRNWQEGFAGADRFIVLSCETLMVYAYTYRIDLWVNIQKQKSHIWQISCFCIKDFLCRNKKNFSFLSVDHVCCSAATYRFSIGFSLLCSRSLIVYSRWEDFSSLPQGEEVWIPNNKMKILLCLFDKRKLIYSLNDLHRAYINV